MPWNKYTEDSDDTRMVFTHPDHPGWRMVEKHPELGPGLRIIPGSQDEHWDVEVDMGGLITNGYGSGPVTIPWVFMRAMVEWFRWTQDYNS